LTPTTVILGGGVGGLATAKALRKRLGREHRIVVVDRDDQHRFAASLLWVLSGDRQPADLARPLARLAARGVEFVRAAVSAIDPATRTVTLDDGRTLTGDHLVLALGAELDRTKPAGLAENGHCLYDTEGVVGCAMRSPRSIGGAWSCSPPRPPTSARPRPTRPRC
jgi:sulfide:quinone oxidoreductase